MATESIIPGVPSELLTRLRESLRDSTSYHRSELIRRTLRRLAIIDMKLRGATRREICDVLRCGPATVCLWWRRYREAGTIEVVLERLAVKKPGPRH